MGVAYEELVEGAMNDACRQVDTPTWHTKGGNRLTSLLATFRWRTLRCFMAASHCATTVEMSATADKQLGLLVFESLQVNREQFLHSPSTFLDLAEKHSERYAEH